MNTCRSRKIPNAVARNGADSPMNVLVQPSPSTVWKLTTTIASVGHEQRGDEQEEQQPLARELQDRERIRREHGRDHLERP